MKDRQLKRFRRQVRLAQMRYSLDGEWRGTVRLDDANAVRLPRKLERSEN